MTPPGIEPACSTVSQTIAPLRTKLLCNMGKYLPISHRSGRQPKTYVKAEAAITVFELMMMSAVSPETC
jgi:hypothetical protein